MSLLVPSIVETTSRGERSSDLYSGLLSNRIVFLGHPIGPEVANLVCAQLLHLAAEHPERSLDLYVNSPGGDIDAALAVLDTMRHIRPAVRTVCFGSAGSVAALLVAAGEPGQRAALPNARFLLHQPASERQGQISDLLLAADVVDRQRRKIEQILAEVTNSSPEQIRSDTDRDLAFDASEAVEYGLIDDVLDPANTHDTTAPLRPAGSARD